MRLRKGLHLEYALFSTDFTGEWKGSLVRVLEATKELQNHSGSFCLERLNPWTADPTQPNDVADLDGLDFGEYGASQVLYIMDILAVGSLDNVGSESDEKIEGSSKVT